MKPRKETDPNLQEVYAMFKKFLSALVIVSLILTLAAGMAFATPEAAVLTLNPISDIILDAPSKTVNVTGTISFSSELKALGLSVSTNGVDFTAYGNVIKNTNQNYSTLNYSFPWTVTAPGIYYLKVTADVANQQGLLTKVIAVVVKLPDTTPKPTDDKDSPAAPALAKKILDQMGIKPQFMGVNLISEVARAMAPGAKFPVLVDGKTVYLDKNAPGYEAAVQAFLVNRITELKAQAAAADKEKEKGNKPAAPGKSTENKGKGKTK